MTAYKFDLTAIFAMLEFLPSQLLENALGVFPPQVGPSLLIRNPRPQFSNMECIVHVSKILYFCEPLLIRFPLS
jgi:hypothetical protein